jgi:hypothetical protein
MQEAAQFALDYLKYGNDTPQLVNELPVFTPKEVLTFGNTLVLVDLENYPQMVLTNGFVYPNTDFIGFIGKCSSLGKIFDFSFVV